jgi:hypothetical protein
MAFYSEKTREKYRKKLIQYIKDNLNITWKQIVRDTKIKPERVFEGSLREAYEKANVPPSGYHLRRTREEQTQEVLEFIKSNPDCTVTEVQDVTGVTIPRVFGSIKTAYVMAGEDYLTKPVSMTDIKQLNRYIEATEGCSSGILVTHDHTKGKRSKLYIEGNEIFIISLEQALTGM